MVCFFFPLFNACENSGLDGTIVISSLSISWLSRSLPFEFSLSSSSQSSRIDLSVTLPLRSVITYLTWSMCAFYWILGFDCGWAGNLLFTSTVSAEAI